MSRLRIAGYGLRIVADGGAPIAYVAIDIANGHDANMGLAASTLAVCSTRGTLAVDCMNAHEMCAFG